MKYTEIAFQKHSQADLSGIIRLESEYLASKAVEEIRKSKWVNSPSTVELGESGAFQVGGHVVFNTFSQDAYDSILDLVVDLDIHDPESLGRELWNSLVDTDRPYREARDFAILLFPQLLPGATAEAIGKEQDKKDCEFTLSYRGTKFTAYLFWAGENTRIMFFADPKVPTCDAEPDIEVYEETDEYEIKKHFDDFVEKNKVTPVTAMFKALDTLDTSRKIPAKTAEQLKITASLFFRSYLPEATMSEIAADGDEDCQWIEAWFLYKGTEFHVDFVSRPAEKTEYLNLWSTRSGVNVDVAKVTPESLRETIESLDDNRHFQETTEETQEPTKDKSLEERVKKLEGLVKVIQAEIDEIKKNI